MSYAKMTNSNVTLSRVYSETVLLLGNNFLKPPNFTDWWSYQIVRFQGKLYIFFKFVMCCAFTPFPISTFLKSISHV